MQTDASQNPTPQPDDSQPTQGRSALPLYAGAASVWFFKALFFALTISFFLFIALNFLAVDPAFAQEQGGAGDGGRIQGTIDNAANFLSTLMVSLGTLGFLGGIAVKAVARTNENMHHASHMAMTGSGLAVAGGLLAPDIISLIQSFVGGGA